MLSVMCSYKQSITLTMLTQHLDFNDKCLLPGRVSWREQVNFQ